MHMLHASAHWHRLANMTKPFMCSGDAAFFVKLL